MSFDMGDIEELKCLYHHVHNTRQLPEEETHFLPPRMEEGKVRRAVTASQGIVVEGENTVEVSVETELEEIEVEPEPLSGEEKVEGVHARVEGYEVEEDKEKSLVVGEENASVLVGDSQGGTEDSGEEEQVCVSIVARESSGTLAGAIKVDSTLATARTLADQTAD